MENEETNEEHTIQVFDEVASTLLSGSVDRQPLPLEIVRLIARLADFYITAQTLRSSNGIDVHAWSEKLVTSLWLETQPFSASDIHKIATITIQTVSRHQGWVSFKDQGSWSYFTLAILSPEGTEDSEKDRVRVEGDRRLIWRSHENPVESTGWVDITRTFDAHHEIWPFMNPGDSIGLFACARFGAWSCEGKSAKITLKKFYEP